ncbi:MAG: hypothetical protein ACREBS_00085 [Nitrososphaerales archaeon]
MEPMMSIAVTFAVLNSVVLVILLVIYGRIAVVSQAAYSIGLAIFALFLLAQNIMTIVSYMIMSPLFGHGTLPFLSIISAFEFVGLLVLAKITF